MDITVFKASFLVRSLKKKCIVPKEVTSRQCHKKLTEENVKIKENTTIKVK